MSPFLLYFLIGLACGFPLFFIGFFFYKKIKNTMERRAIKKLIKQGKFLSPVDIKDYDSEAWKEYIDPFVMSEGLKSFNQNIFKVNYEEEQVVDKAKDYIIKTRLLGFNDDEIIKEFKKKNYPISLVSRLFQEIKNEQYKKLNGK